MKKFVSVLLCVILALSLCTVTAFAAETDYLEASSTVSAENGTVELVLTAAKPLTNATFHLSFDHAYLSWTGGEVNAAVWTDKATETGVTYRLAVSTADTIQTGETVATIRFDLTGGWDETDVTVTVENWNETLGVNASTTLTVAGTGYRFQDVAAEDWFFEAVDRMAADGHIKGVDANHFGPALPMNRASFVTLLGRLAGVEDTNAETCFVDVPADSFYSGFVAWAYENGITNGSDATHFNPTGQISRAEMVTFLYRYAKYAGVDVTVEDVEATLGAFADAEAVLEITWAAEPFAWAVENGIINGMEGNLNPYGISNRAQVAVMLYRFFYAQ